MARPAAAARAVVVLRVRAMEVFMVLCLSRALASGI
jgi:hypothetical protein